MVATKKPAASVPARAQFLRCWIYAGDLPDMSSSQREGFCKWSPHRLALRKRIDKNKHYRLTERVNLRIELRSGSAEASSPPSEMNGPAGCALLSNANAGGLSISS